MLTVEILRQNPAFAGLTDAQFSAIAEMSKNDENTVIGTRIGEVHGQYDTDILNASGVAKNAGEKSYDYAKRVIADFKAKAEAHKAIKAELDSAKARITELEASGADEATKKELKDTKTRAEQLQASLKAKETEFANTKAELEKQLMNTHVDYAFKAATAGLKFKAGISEAIQSVILNAARAEVLANGTPELIDDDKGGKRIAFRGADGNLVNNPEKGLTPYTIQDLVMRTSLKDAIAVTPKQTGGGTNPIEHVDHSSSVLDFSGIKTQVEADNMIEKYLMESKGLTRDSSEFAEESMRLRNEANIANLPIR